MTANARIFSPAGLLYLCLAMLLLTLGVPAHAQTPLTPGTVVSNSDSTHLYSMDPTLLPAAWSVVGVRPPIDVDYDLPLFSDSLGTVQVTASAQDGPAIDFDVINFHDTSLVRYFPETVSRAGSGSYWIEWSHGGDTIPSGGFTAEIPWNADEVVKIFEFRAAQVGTQPLTLVRTGGDGDLGIGVFSLSDPPFAAGRSGAIAAGSLNGNSVTVSFDADTLQWYGVVVWSNNGSSSSFRVGNLPSPAITVTSPNGGENWNSASNHAITWASAGLTGRAVIQVLRTFPAGAWETIIDTSVTLGTYTWTVTNPGTLNGRIRIVSDLFPFFGDTSDADFTVSGMHLFSPNGGENWTVGSAHLINWAGVGFAGNVSLQINRTYPNGTWMTIISNTPNDSTQSWTVSGPTSTTVRIRARSSTTTSIADVSDGNLTISPTPALTITAPNGGETWQIGTPFNITWTSVNIAGQVMLDIDRNYPSGIWESITDNADNINSYSWTVTGPEVAATGRMRIRSVADTAVGDTSNASFSIVAFVPPFITIVSPNGAENWDIGSVHPITWTTINVPENVRIQLDRNYPSGNWETLADSVANTGSYDWTLTGPASLLNRIRIVSTLNALLGDTSNANFAISIPQTITVISPNGGESWMTGSQHNITWQSTGIAGTVAIQIKTNYPSGNWATIAGSVENSGSYLWTITQTATSNARIRIRWTTDTGVRDTSNANFTLTSPTITVTSPNGGETLAIDSLHDITWGSVGPVGAVTLDLNRDFPAGAWEVISDSSDNTGTFLWTATGSASTNARVRVRARSNPAIGDTSDASFTLSTTVPTSLQLTSPNGGENWGIGASQTITWRQWGITGLVRVQLNRSYPSTDWETLTDSAGTSGPYVWVVTGPASTTARIRILSIASPEIGDTSNFNFAISVPVNITVTSPNGGENWMTGTTHSILWNSSGLTGNVAIDLNRNFPGTVWTTLAGNIANTGSFDWTVSGAGTSTARVRIRSLDSAAIVDTSNANFAITLPPGIIVHSPNGGENWYIGSTHAVSWAVTSINDSLAVELDRSYPSGTWEDLGHTAGADTSLSWLVNAPVTTTARIRVRSLGTTTYADTSNGNFSVSLLPILTLTAPNGGEVYRIGQSHPITWTSQGISGRIGIRLNRLYPTGPWVVLADSVDNTGSFAWNVTGAASTSSRVRIFSIANPAIADTSNANFTLQAAPAITVVTPNGGETLIIGSADTVRWTVTNITGNVDVYLNRDYPAGAWTLLGSATVPDTSLVLMVNAPATNHARVKAMLPSDTTVYDLSDADYSIIQPVLTLLRPHGGEVLPFEQPDTIRWSRDHANGVVRAEWDPEYPSAWQMLGETMGDSLIWIPQVTSEAARVRIFLVANSVVSDTCDSNFVVLDLSALQQFSGIPTHFSLAAIYPNPFNPTTEIVLGVPTTSPAKVRIFDVLGRQVACLFDGQAQPGYMRLTWNASDFASGTYIVSFEARGFVKRQSIRYLR